MSAKHMTLIQCDQCDATFGPVIGPVQHARSLAAVQAGWARLRGPHGLLDDTCGACSKARREAIFTEHVRRLGAVWDTRSGVVTATLRYVEPTGPLDCGDPFGGGDE
jgi:hypothetical protein